MDWYMLTLTGGEVAAGVNEQKKKDFFEAFDAAKAPRSMALFEQKREDGGLDLFFTPESGQHAAGLLEEWNCSRCARPSMVDLHLLVGHNEMTYYLP